jgi:hypothetical protein
MDSERDAEKMPASFQIVASDDGVRAGEDSNPTPGMLTDFGSGFKTCKTCNVPQPMNAFRKEKSGVGGRKASCRVCMADDKPKPKRLIVDHQAALTSAYYRAICEGKI